MNIDLKNTLDTNSAAGQQLLDDLQGNILTPHKREHTMQLFISFGTPDSKAKLNASRKKIKVWLSKLLDKSITTAKMEFDVPSRKSTFSSVFFSSQGYEYMGWSRPNSDVFRDGMRERRRALRDSKFQDWLPRYKVEANQLHALLIIGAARGTIKPSRTKHYLH